MLKKLFLYLLTAALLCFALSACGPASKETEKAWSVYWYLCGSDLESWHGCASADLAEMMAVELPENLQIIIQTGGALQWHRDDISPEETGRYIYDSKGFRKLEALPRANMGEADTLSDFLSFCAENYPAERTMALFWNHGGGSVAGAEFDANYQFDSLTLDEFREAFERANMPELDIIGFDACLMATVDAADAFSDAGRYLVASEELEPGSGWYYTGWLEALAADPAMDGEQLGRAICDAYLEGCELAGTAEDITLSLTDMSRIDPLLEAYDAMGTELLLEAIDNIDFYAAFSRAAIGSESYGGNTEEQGYTNMVDLGHLARNSRQLLPESAEAVLAAIEDCVIYKVSGEYRREASGLSCYYSFNGDMENFVDYTDIGCSEAFKYLYGYGLSGKVSEAGAEYVRSAGGAMGAIPEQAELFDISLLEGLPISVDDMGNAELYVGEQAAGSIVSARSILVWFRDDKMLNLGWSDTSSEDFEQGLFTDLIDGFWPSIDGHLVHTEVVYQGDAYTVYSVPVLLNGEQCNLRVFYDEQLQDYTVLGARKGLTDEGMADKNLIRLQVGDELTFVYQQRELDASGGFGYASGDTITVTEETAFYETPLPPGEYGMMFRLSDARNGRALSEVLHFDLDEYYIYFY